MAPGYVTLINITLLALLYLFIWRVVKAIYVDIYERPVPFAEAREVMEKQQKSTPRDAMLEVIKSVYVNEGRVYPLTDLITIGRSTETDIVLRDPLVSHQHSRIVKRLNTWYIMDLDSTNGTFVGKQAIAGQTELKNGQKIRIGETTFLVKM